MKEGFLWGAATSSHQIEGHNENNDWWAWEHEGHIEGGARSGAATDHWNRFREDLRLAADLGLNSYRFSIEWSRIEPKEGKWDRAALDWYASLIAECEKRRLMPMLTLHHFTSPQWFAEQGGFAWSESPKRFADFVKHVASGLGPHVPLWCTFNEPMVLAVGAYLGKFMPPAKFAPKLAGVACRNLLKAHVAAYETLHSVIEERRGPWRLHPVSVGIAHNMVDFLPDRAWHPLDRLLTSMISRFYNRSWLDAVTGRKQSFGIPGLIPKPKPVARALNRRTVDFIGVNYYTKAYVHWRPRDTAEGSSPNIPFGLAFGRRTEPASDLGWAIHPEGLGKMLRLAHRYGLPIYVTENGIADREDRLRAKFLLSHLGEIARAAASGIDIRGYFHWSLLDNFEWIKGFGPRFGLYAVDYETFNRTPTKSAQLYRKILSAHEDGGLYRSPDPKYFGR